MARRAKQHAVQGKRMRSRPRRWPIFTSLLVGLLLAVSMGWFVWHGLAPRRQAANEPALIEPPALELTGVDPAVVRAIETARRAVLESPASGPAWGQLGKTLLAHDFHRQAGTCLAQAQRLDPTEARWPYLEGVAWPLQTRPIRPRPWSASR